LKGIVTREGGRGNDPLGGLVEVRDGVYFHRVLKEPLKFIPAARVWNLDEKPLIPDSPLLHCLGKDASSLPIACSRTSSWTIVFCYNAEGFLLPPLLIIRGTSV